MHLLGACPNWEACCVQRSRGEWLLAPRVRDTGIGLLLGRVTSAPASVRILPDTTSCSGQEAERKGQESTPAVVEMGKMVTASRRKTHPWGVQGFGLPVEGAL